MHSAIESNMDANIQVTLRMYMHECHNKSVFFTYHLILWSECIIYELPFLYSLPIEPSVPCSLSSMVVPLSSACACVKLRMRTTRFRFPWFSFKSVLVSWITSGRRGFCISEQRMDDPQWHGRPWHPFCRQHWEEDREITLVLISYGYWCSPVYVSS